MQLRCSDSSVGHGRVQTDKEDVLVRRNKKTKVTKQNTAAADTSNFSIFWKQAIIQERHFLRKRFKQTRIEQARENNLGKNVSMMGGLGGGLLCFHCFFFVQENAVLHQRTKRKRNLAKGSSVPPPSHRGWCKCEFYGRFCFCSHSLLREWNGLSACQNENKEEGSWGGVFVLSLLSFFDQKMKNCCFTDFLEEVLPFLVRHVFEFHIFFLFLRLHGLFFFVCVCVCSLRFSFSLCVVFFFGAFSCRVLKTTMTFE